MLIKYGDTYFSTFEGKTKTHIYRQSLLTIHDPAILPYQNPPGLDSVLVEFQPYATGSTKELHWVDRQYLRHATTKDFEVGDIISENVSNLARFEIVSIDQQAQAGTICLPPIFAEELDENGYRGGSVLTLEPHECIMVEPVNEPTLDLGLLSGPEPRNNDGRKRCYWCGGKTKHGRGFHLDWYDVCIQCGR